MIVGFVIWSIVAIIIALIGRNCRGRKEAVGFFTFVDPPKVKDVKAYNRAVSNLLISAAAVFEALGAFFMFLEQNSPLFIMLMLAIAVWLIALMVVYLKIEAKYKK